MSAATPGLNTNQIKDHAVERHNLDTADPGQAVVERIIAGSGITLSSTGADSGTGDVTISVTGSAGTGGGTGGTGSVSAATATTFGTVETDVTEANGSVVYTKTTMDTLLAGKISVGAALPESEITGLLTDLGNKVTAGTALPESEVTNLVSDLAGKIAAGTSLPESEIASLVSDLAGKLAAGTVLPESEIANLAADLAARLVVAGTPAVGQVPVVTGVSPLTVGWQTPATNTSPTNAPAEPPGFILSIPGALATGADTLEVLLPSWYSSRPMTRVSSSLRVASTSGSVQFHLELDTGTGAFAAAQTSDTFSIGQSVNQAAPVTAFTTGLTASGENRLRVSITQAGTGASDLTVKVEF